MPLMVEGNHVLMQGLGDPWINRRNVDGGFAQKCRK